MNVFYIISGRREEFKIENSGFYFILKDYLEPETRNYLKPGDIVYTVPKDIDVKNMLYYSNMKEYDKNIILDLIGTAKCRNDINYNLLKGKISIKNINMLNKIKRENNYNQAFLSRYIVKDTCTIAVMINIKSDTYVARKVIKTTKYRDDMPFILYNKILNYIRGYIGADIDIINLGYYMDKKELASVARDIRYFLPNIKTTTSPQFCQIFNHYLTTGVKVVPVYDITNYV